MDLALTELDLHNFRSFEAADVRFSEPWTGIVAPNGAGKTNLLEAVHLLCRLRGFRNEPWTKLRRWDTEAGRVRGLFAGGRERELCWDGSGLQRLEEGDPVGRQRQWITGVPIFGYRPDDDLFFHEAPAERRRYLDWYCSYRDAAYMADLSRYERTLRQRNAALRAPVLRDGELAAWEAVLSETGAAVHRARAAAGTEIGAMLAELWSGLALPAVTLTYRPGGSAAAAELAAELAADRDGDAERGWTRRGPHRDDLVLEFRGRPIKESGSQGFRKLAVIALSAACAMALPAQPGRRLFYLDDIEGELDDRNERALFGVLADLPLQVLLTGVRRPPALAEAAIDWLELAAAVPAGVEVES